MGHRCEQNAKGGGSEKCLILQKPLHQFCRLSWTLRPSIYCIKWYADQANNGSQMCDGWRYVQCAVQLLVLILEGWCVLLLCIYLLEDFQPVASTKLYCSFKTHRCKLGKCHMSKILARMLLLLWGLATFKRGMCFDWIGTIRVVENCQLQRVHCTTSFQ